MTGVPKTFSIIVVEDHDLVREALAAMIGRNPTLDLLGQADNGGKALSLIERFQPDVAIVDFALPDMTGLEVITQARTLWPETRHLILTGSPMDEDERRHLAQFAEGFMHKEAGRDDLISAILEVAEMAPLSSVEIADAVENTGFVNSGSLTKRERSVLREIARGYSVNQIATAFGISPSTVRKHRENIMMKLNLTSTAQLVRTAMQIGQY